jgi:AcrR family transcriptional regulator
MTMSLPADLWPDVKPEAARRLMYAAVVSFAKVGFHATTTRDIATAAGMSPAALYVHFPSKSALLFEISRSGHEQTLALVQSVTSGERSAVDRMRALVEDFVEWHARRHLVARVVQYELEALPEPEFLIVAGGSNRRSGRWSPRAHAPARSPCRTRKPLLAPYSRWVSTWPGGTASAPARRPARWAASTPRWCCACWAPLLSRQFPLPCRHTYQSVPESAY